MLVVRPDLGRNVRISEYRGLTVWLRNDGCTLNVLLTSEADVHGRVACGLEKLDAWMFVEHAFAERPELLPLVSAVL